ncbi:hypothetical protein [Streptomyces sp. NPDC005438]|uniref:hypothetical protein n=1 Tax=Streptomyces sp. NPDC005438 TaxID=3156880 RepID=UPI0033BFB30C
MAETTYDWDRPEGILAALNDTPLPELRRRAAVVTDLAAVIPLYVSASPSYRLGNATRYACNDSGGSSNTLYVTDDGRALLLGLSRDSELHVGRENNGRDFANLRDLYRGVPEDLMRYAGDRTDAYENLTVTDRETGASLLLVSGACWFDGEQWHFARGLLDLCAAEGLNPAFEAGLVPDEYLLGHEFTLENFFEEYIGPGVLSDEEWAESVALARPVFERYPQP